MNALDQPSPAIDPAAGPGPGDLATAGPVGADGRRGFPWARVAVVTLVAGITAMWVYAFFFAPSRSPDKVHDAGWTSSAEAACASSKTAIDKLPDARSFKNVTPLSEALRQRADVGEQATNLLAGRVAALRALPVTDATDKGLVDRWLGDYDAYLSDRRDQVRAWRADQNPMFAETASDNGAPASLRMDEFARLNAMPSCKVPQDIG